MTQDLSNSPVKDKEKKSRGRPMSFDREVVLLKVLDLFWSEGYQNMSFNQIASETGLTRASLYNAFQDKETLLLEALNLYFKNSPDAILETVSEGENIGAIFEKVLSASVNLYTSSDTRRGCMGVNCINELVAQDSDIGRQVAELLKRKRLIIKQLFRVAVEQDELPGSTDLEITSNLLMTYMQGLSVYSKSGISAKALRSMNRMFLTQVGFSR